ncbi:MAG: fibronectin type III domain-containing protein [Treponema sp.]|nr:fibronectin type III domain-containing protein [Treponema sp.]
MKNYIRKSGIVCVCMGILCTSLFGKEISLGGKKGWPELEVIENVTKGEGRFGYDCIELVTNSFQPEFGTDLIINFEDNNPISYGNYIVEKNEMQKIKTQEFGKSAGLSRDNGGMTLSGQSGTFFGNEGLNGSFSIEFWLNPALAENGETIFQWHSSRTMENQLIYQTLNSCFESGHLKWSLSNIFDSAYPGNQNLILKGVSTIIPDVWTRHTLSYDAETGLLEYLVNGYVEDSKYITSTGHEGGDVYLVFLGVPASFDICPQYTGQIDDFRIMKRPYSLPLFQNAENAGSIEYMKYVRSGGYFRSKPIMVSAGSVLNSIDVEMYTPKETAVNLYVRSGDNRYNWTDTYPEWKTVEPGQELTGISGLFFQVAADLYPDGNGSHTPNVTEIKLNYTELPLPLPPFSVSAVAGDGCVTLKWNYSVDETAGGYYIYYGNRSGEYLGRIAVEGASPINVGNTTGFTLTGLENGTIYYFAVASWSRVNENVIGELSKEVFARPKKILR